MKVMVTLKDPDGFYDAVQDAVKAEIREMPGLDEDERETLIEKRVEKVNDALGRWVEYGEYVTLVFDTEAGTAVVQPLK